FGDGSANQTTTTGSVQHTFTTTVGSPFNVAVTITDANGVASASPANVLTVAARLTGATVSVSGSGQIVTLTATSTGVVAPLSYNWSFGDGSANATTTTNSVTHTYAITGTFNVAVTITDSNGVASASPTKAVTVPIGVVIPVHFGPTTTIVGNTAFVGTIDTVSGSSGPFTCTWGFGDGTSPVVAPCASPVSQQHTYIAS